MNSLSRPNVGTGEQQLAAYIDQKIADAIAQDRRSTPLNYDPNGNQSFGTGTSLNASAPNVPGGVKIRPGASTYYGKGQAVIEMASGVGDETSPAELVAITDGPLSTDNASLLISSPAKGGRDRAFIQIFGADADTSSLVAIAGYAVNLSANVGFIGTQTSQVIQYNVASGGSVTVNGTLTVNGVLNTTRMGFRLSRAANQSVANATPADLSFDTESQDTNSFYTSGTTVTVPTGCAGLYSLTAQAVCGAAVGGRGFVDLNVSGTVYRSSIGSLEDRTSSAVTVPLAVGDTVKVTVFQTSGATQNWTGILHGYRVGS